MDAMTDDNSIFYMDIDRLIPEYAVDLHVNAKTGYYVYFLKCSGKFIYEKNFDDIISPYDLAIKLNDDFSHVNMKYYWKA